MYLVNFLHWKVLWCLYLGVYFQFTGAALVLNSVYTVLREEESIVNQFWLELLYHMVMNLSLSEETESILGSQEQVVTAVNHIERVLKEKASLFNKVNIEKTYFLKIKCLRNIVHWLSLNNFLNSDLAVEVHAVKYLQQV